MCKEILQMENISSEFTRKIKKKGGGDMQVLYLNTYCYICKYIFFMTWVRFYDSALHIYMCVSVFYVVQIMWVSWGLKSNGLLVGIGSIGVVPSVGAFLKDSNPYLRKFRRKSRKTLNSYVAKRDQK